MADIKRGKLSEIKPTRKNSNKHTARGLKALDNSMAQDGYVAPMTATADGEIIDGDARLHAAFERFGDEAIVIHHDGKKPIVMIRDDIPNADDPMARRIHYRANMVQALDFDLDPAQVMADIESGFDFEAIDVDLEDLNDMLKSAGEAVLKEKTEELRPKNFMRVLVSIPVDDAIFAKEHIDALSKISGAEVDYGAN